MDFIEYQLGWMIINNWLRIVSETCVEDKKVWMYKCVPQSYMAGDFGTLVTFKEEDAALLTIYFHFFLSS